MNSHGPYRVGPLLPLHELVLGTDIGSYFSTLSRGPSMIPLMRQFAAEAQRLRNRQSEPQFGGVVACRDLALQPFQAVGSGPGPSARLGDTRRARRSKYYCGLVVVRSAYADSVRQKYPTQEARQRFSQDKCGYSVLR